MADDATRLLSHRCNVFVANLNSAEGSAVMDGATTKHFTVGHHYWLQRALQDHPWRVTDPTQADVIFINATFAYSSHADRARFVAANNEVHHCKDSPSQCAALGLSTSPCRPTRFATGTCSQQECAGKAQRLGVASVAQDGSKTHWIKDFSMREAGAVESSQELIAPFVVYQPAWLIGEAASGRGDAGLTRVPWNKRRLVFFAGHMPLPWLYSPIRWDLWRRLVHDPRATVFTSDLHRFLGYELCTNLSLMNTTNVGERRSKIRAYLRANCERCCELNPSKARNCATVYRPPHEECPSATGGNDSAYCRQAEVAAEFWVRSLPTKCQSPRHPHNMSADLRAGRDAAIQGSRMDLEEYMRQSMSHKFCLVAHGDDPTTHKLPEVMAIAGMGGCLPLVVHTLSPEAHLPYAKHIDYCRVGFLLTVSKHGIPDRDSVIGRVLSRLEQVTADEAAERHAVAAVLRGAFVVREGATLEQPAAAHYIVASMCARALRLRNVSSCGMGGHLEASMREGASNLELEQRGALNRCWKDKW